MKNHLFTLYGFRTALISGALAMALTGCMEAYTAMSYIPSAFQYGSAIYDSIEDAEISATVSDKVAIVKVKKIAVFPTKGNKSYVADDETAIINSITASLQSEGLTVIDTMQIEDYLRRKKVKAIVNQVTGEEFFSNSRLIQGAFALGADAVMLADANIGMEMKSSGFGWGGGSIKSKSTVTGTSARLLDRRKRILLTLNLSYTKGQSTQEAGKALGLATAIEISNPGEDVKAEIKARGAKG